MEGEEHRCPTCGQPVETVVRRHKTLGAWVPVWEPGPCRNPRCGPDTAAAADRPEEPGRSPDAAPAPSPDAAPAPSPEQTSAPSPE
ncbi:hypothetical protein [Streptomyces anandii]|uniref:hypothetical protein n=1 Tax=Streptomyces anandii TaxID=285454 RepID=UPI0019B522F2|nr:hypothetical protein [Streptomyces anandii]GGX83826.1 hypothetical protein GCM10010510_31050 [Streptomyces anandii JCM 4720]